MVRFLRTKARATDAQLTTLSRLFNSNARLDSTITSGHSPFVLPDRTHFKPIPRANGSVTSGVELSLDNRGNLWVRFMTDMKCFDAQLIHNRTLTGQIVLQPGKDHAELTHDVTIPQDDNAHPPVLNVEYEAELNHWAQQHDVNMREPDSPVALRRNRDAFVAVAEFAKQEHSDESFRFIDEVDRVVQAAATNKMVNSARALAMQFVVRGAPDEVNLSAPHRLAVSAALDALRAVPRPPSQAELDQLAGNSDADEVSALRVAINDAQRLSELDDISASNLDPKHVVALQDAFKDAQGEALALVAADTGKRFRLHPRKALDAIRAKSGA